jgi:hypothetical protein
MDVCEPEMSSPKYRDLVDRYVSICNRALQKNGGMFPFKQIFMAIKSANQTGPVEVIIIDSTPQETYAFHIKPEGITAEPHSQCENCQCVRAWNVEADYLRRIVKDPAFYIKNPARLNWEWTHDA